MRITLLCTESLRTPACPGFGVSGDRKISCFDRFGRQRQVARELRLWGDVREGFERVQMAMDFGVQGFAARMADGFVRVQLSRRSALRVTRAAASIERVRVSEESRGPVGGGCSSAKASEAAGESGVRDPVRAPLFGSFERVQMSDEHRRPGVETALSAGPFERVQMTGVSVNGRGAMPHLK
jgi:hypothetical protein